MSQTHRLAKALKNLKMTPEEWFRAQASADALEKGIGQMTLFKALRRMSDELQNKLPAKEAAGFIFSDDCILEMMSFLDPNQDGTVTLEEIKDGLKRAREDPNSNAEQAAAAKVLKQLERAMVEEGGDLAEIFASIDEDGSGSVNSEELTEALANFHQKRLKNLNQWDMGPVTEAGGRFCLTNHTFTRKQFLKVIEDWMRTHNIHDADLNLRDVETFLNFVDPYGDNEITLNEISDALEFARKGGGVKAVNSSGGEVFAYSEVRAARILSRISSSLFSRRILLSEVFRNCLERQREAEAQERREETARKNIIPEKEDEKKGDDEADEENYDDDMFEVDGDVKGNHVCDANVIVAELCNIVQTDCETPKVDHIVAAVLEAQQDMAIAASQPEDSMYSRNKDAKKKKDLSGEIIAIPKQVLRMAIVDVCNVANRRVDILSLNDVQLACDYFCVGDRDYVKEQDVQSSFQYAASGYLVEHEGRTAQLKLVRKVRERGLG